MASRTPSCFQRLTKTLTSGNTKRGLFTGQDFIDDAEKDHYTCPAGQPAPDQGAGPIRPLGRHSINTVI